MCAGSLISNHHVLTTAHCISWTSSPNDINVLLQEDYDVSDVENYIFHISQINIHPNYHRDPVSYLTHYDYSILKLASPLTFSEV